MKTVEAIVDGGMIGSNPGKGGWGGRFRIYDGGVVIDEKFFGFTFGEEIVTNNVAEWRAEIGAVQIFAEYYYDHHYQYYIISDAKLVVKQARDIWACKDPHLKRLRAIYGNLCNALPLCSSRVNIQHRRRKHTMVAHDYIAKILGRKK